MQKIIPSLWFNYNAEEAINFYLSIFKDGKITERTPYRDNPHGKEGELMCLGFELFGQEYLAINGGPDFSFTNALSFMVQCEDQAEADRLWEALLADGGKVQECGWLFDKFGLAWQITPRRLNEMRRDPNEAKSTAAMNAMMKMKKIDIAELEKAYAAA